MCDKFQEKNYHSPILVDINPEGGMDDQ